MKGQTAQTLLSVRDLKTVVETSRGTFPAVDGVSFDLQRGAALGIVGESGSGKSMLSLSILGLLPQAARVSGGEALLEGERVLGLPEKRMAHIRGRRIGMVFQEPLTSFDPLYTIGDQIAESLRRHFGLSRSAARARAVELLDSVGIPNPGAAYDEYPFQFSGGMRQRAMIAMALAPEPDLLIADEPTTALDVTIQAQILALLKRLQKERGIAMLFISHNLGVIAEVADEVMVMYGGQAMERSEVERIFDDPAHPYTKSLLEARPSLEGEPQRLKSIPGQVPSLESRPSGCPFNPRCPRASAACASERPPELGLGDGRIVACHLYGSGKPALGGRS